MRGAGRAAFAATLLLIAGMLNIIYGIGALDGANIFTGDRRYVLTDLNTLGWVLIVLGLFTRLAALGMLVFVAVQSYVDIAFHGVDAETIGALFDRLPSATIADQRALWAFLLVTLVIKGGGALSLDALLSRLLRARPGTGARQFARPAE